MARCEEVNPKVPTKDIFQAIMLTIRVMWTHVKSDRYFYALVWSETTMTTYRAKGKCSHR